MGFRRLGACGSALGFLAKCLTGSRYREYSSAQSYQFLCSSFFHRPHPGPLLIFSVSMPAVLFLHVFVDNLHHFLTDPITQDQRASVSFHLGIA